MTNQVLIISAKKTPGYSTGGVQQICYANRRISVKIIQLVRIEVQAAVFIAGECNAVGEIIISVNIIQHHRIAVIPLVRLSS